MPRLHLESMSAWERRHCDAMRRYHDAEHAMLESPDATHRHVGRSIVYSLPVNHPLTLRRLAALYPDGPSYEELAEIAGVVKLQDRPN